MAEPHWRQLLFEVGDYLFAVDAREVRGVMVLDEATPVPGAVPGVLGLINLRGRLVVAGELATLLGLASTGGQGSVLVLFENGTRQLALGVDRVVGVVPYTGAELDVDGDLLEGLGARDLVNGVGQSGPRPFLQLNLDSVFARVLGQPGDQDQSIRLVSVGG
ncbi:MAG: chemotaxis protein CheW [Gemmatimonadota bacterium]|nr:MAG: chemotaxis protein CheW [Gemmatimonadota bacterium]